MGELFFRESGQPGTWNPQHFVADWERAIAGGYRFCFVVEEEGKFIAALGASLGTCPNTGDRMSAENFYYAYPHARGKAIGLLQAYENEAKTRGVRRVWMVCLAGMEEERLRRWYERRGYLRREIFFVKEL